MVPILDLKREYQELKSEIDAAIQRVLLSGGFVGGPEVAALEEELAAYLGVPQVVSCASGTDALILALRAMGVGPGDEVITTPFTFIATLEAILHVGARPVLVDIEPHTYNLNPALLEGALSPRTKAILPVHLYGQVAPMGEILAFARKHGLLVLEDAAQAIGARYLGEGQAQMAGTLGQAGAFSLYPSKNLGAYGDGGFIATADPALAEEARLLATHGSKVRYQHVRALGYTSRLDALQAAILRVKLPYLEGWNARRRAIASRYSEALKHRLLTPCEMPYAHHIYHQYTVRHPERDRLAAHLQAQGIGSSVHYPLPAHLQPAYRHLAQEGRLPVAEAAAREVLSLPMHPFLEEAQVEAVIKAVLSF
ncbi:UDP-2-acetamido-2-deoxy-3-oxo-D-glucuronate aminotransferase [Meiothermus luteus]|jgi:dTDP-4-amino-4,6-dideoxygalactose transaminase|uniref:UDP-2-acetamido-2-deoxy-3-oxo-D-glucuronate aminotransferase n=1 Tax=Meiothermus luteus TaxID=2026184 RepID=A0A399ED97_9DEIN|nr:DegT/DnrJ/EryC1/StrS family aminotransferase [Meiothermus luteus]RIH81776.1 UDP-2-acetamido-2-deoxy-3-oxo-D-glucuronate aminotransferase [Meiothermus luteus]RMH57951.1 MAG: aminotransferase class V-fold PLP-dependent enzyme [Deinococcota bacterium]